jgi:glycosyltransferase involved in cell wall biosynthesis
LSGGIESQIAALGIGASVRFTGYVPSSDLPALYSLAEMFVFPSLYEGFGLPVVEAMACGTPVITGSVPALEEVAGGSVERVTRLDADALGAAMAELARSPARRAELSALGVARARTFSWDRAARETLRVYRRVATRLRAAVPMYPKAAVDPMSAGAGSGSDDSQHAWSRRLERVDQ